MSNVLFQQNQGTEEDGDEMQDFPHSLELGDECESKKNLKNEEDVASEELGWKHGRSKNVEESGHDVDKADDLEVLGLRCLHDFNGNCFNKKATQ